MSEQEEKRQRIYDLHNAKNKPTFLCQLWTMQKKKILEKEKEEWRIEPKTKRSLFNCPPPRYGD